MISNRKLVKEAQQAEKIDEILAAERALANARSIGREVPKSYMDKIEDVAKEAGTRIHVDPEKFYQDDKDRKDKLQEYAIYKKKLVSPTYHHLQGDSFAIPYTSDVEEQMDSELAKLLNDKTEISDIENDADCQRTIRTITRGNFFEILQSTNVNNPKTFVLCMDFSDESKYALEWCIGTVLVDGSVLYILNVIEDDEYSSMNLNGIQPKDMPKNEKKFTMSREQLRTKNVETLTKDVTDLLKLTKLQVHVVIQSSHHPIPRHFIVEVIKHISPTMVMVGSKGSSAIKGVLLGSLSNYLVRKSNVPVMVVKNKLKKLSSKKKFSNNIAPLHSLSEAKID
ncbi:unnamed protein product [Ambrosiozyma monospora]|uniref:Unnamed protein product n=1 Tax=Ambrosiozyma monospora TaxID=43982 RepID=A0ACB5TC35_AMBMO|nr:unnamed protein product [Ambrosiozyma monospora]